MNEFTQNNGFVNFYGFHPVDLSVAWVDDHAHLSWPDNYNGAVAFDIWRSVNNAPYQFVATTAIGATTYDDHCAQNADVRWYVEINGRGAACNPVGLRTPLCFWTDQNPLVGVTLNTLNVAAGGTVHVEWGDGVGAVDLVGANAGVANAYANPGNFCIQFSGDVDMIEDISINGQVVNFGDLTPWNLPASLLTLDLSSCAFTGQPGTWTYPATMTLIALDDNLFDGDITTMLRTLPPVLVTLTMDTGNTFTANLPATPVVDLPDTLETIDLNGLGLNGHLKGLRITQVANPCNYDFSHNNFLSMPKGLFENVATLDCHTNTMDYKELNDFMDWLDNYFINGVVPAGNAAISINGVAMGGIAGTTFNQSLVSLTAKWVAAGHVLTLNYNV